MWLAFESRLLDRNKRVNRVETALRIRWLAGLAGWSVDRLVGRSVGQSVSQSVSRSVGQSVSRSVTCRVLMLERMSVVVAEHRAVSAAVLTSSVSSLQIVLRR